MPLGGLLPYDEQGGSGAADPALGPLDVSDLLPAPAPQQQMGQPDRKKAKRREWLKLAALIPAAVKGGPGALEGVLAGFQQADLLTAQRQQQESGRQRQQMLDQQAADQQAFGRNLQVANYNRQLAQEQATRERQQEQDRRALMDSLRGAIGSVTSSDAARLVLDFYAPRFEALGVPRSQVEAFVMETATPSALQTKAAQARLEAAHKTLGDKAPQFSMEIDGEVLPYTEVQRRAGFQRTPNAGPIGPTYADRFPETRGLPIGSDPLPLTSAGLPDLNTATNVLNRMGLFARPNARGRGRQSDAPTEADVRRELSAADEDAAFILRTVARGGQVPADVSKRWARIRRAWEKHGFDFDARRDSLRLQVERQLRNVGDDLLSDVDFGDDLPADVSAPAVTPVPRGRGAGPGTAQPAGGPRTATMAEVQAVAQRMGISVREARQQLEARGVVIR